MSLLQYTSKEMFSSTELIRKSKSIYEKLNNKEIEKAIILRDGKPSFMLLNFETYEIIMDEYLRMKGTKTLLEKTIIPRKKIQAPKIEEKKIKIVKTEEIITKKNGKLIISNELLEIEQISDFNANDLLNDEEKLLGEDMQELPNKEIRRKSLASNQDALKEVLASMGKDDNKDQDIRNGTIRQKLKEFWD